ncbi:MAG: hypothetical protein MSE26_00820, partial [Lachnospiraceae bacterium]|nr:hypothetical protein [Lachnospiraceae bacterium]
KTKNEEFSQEVPRFLLFFVCKGTGGLPVTMSINTIQLLCVVYQLVLKIAAQQKRKLPICNFPKASLTLEGANCANRPT